jgi:hypothetical protein
MTYRSMIAAWARRRLAQLADRLQRRRPRRYAFRLRDIRAAFTTRYDTWDLSRWMR